MPSPSQVTPYIRNALDLNRFSNKLGDDVVKVYVDAAQELLRDFAAQDGTTETRMAQLNAQAQQIRDTIATAYADKYPDLINQLTDLANQQAKFQSKTLKKQIPKGVGVNVRTVEVSKDYVQALAEGDPKAKLKLSGDEIIRRSLPRILPDDQPALKKVIEDLADSSSKTLEKSLRSGLLLGKTNDEIVRGLLAGNKIPKGSPLKKTESAVRTVVQSAVIGVGAEAQLLTLEANKDITDEYEFLATLDNRTSPQCRALDSKVFKVNDPQAPRPPIHFRCRSTLIPSLTKFFKDNNVEMDTGTRASMDGQVPADLNYEQWLKTQTPAFQDEVLGKGKANLFRKGMGLAQMVREDGTAIALKDLGTAKRLGNPQQESQLQQQEETKNTSPVNEERLAITKQLYQKYVSEELIKQAEKTLQQLVDEADIMIRVPSSATIEKIINTGRFKTQFETGKSRGVQNRKIRKEVEKELFNYPEDLPDENRPLYGYLGDISGDKKNLNGGKLDGYGEIVVRLKKEVKQFATLTGNDSLATLVDNKNKINPEGGIYPSRLDNVSVGSFASPERINRLVDFYGEEAPGDSIRAVAESKNITDARNVLGDYLEVQMHKQITTSDIAEIVFYNKNKPSEYVINWAKENNVIIKQETKEKYRYR